MKRDPNSKYMGTGEVADLFEVDPSTVIRWTELGRLPVAVRTLGGQRRYLRDEVLAVHIGTVVGGAA